MFRLKCKVDVEKAKLNAEIDRLKHSIAWYEEERIRLQRQLANVKPTDEDIKACRMLYTNKQADERFIHCRNNMYTISTYRNDPAGNPSKFQTYAEKKKYKQTNGAYFISLSDMYSYLIKEAYFMGDDSETE